MLRVSTLLLRCRWQLFIVYIITLLLLLLHCNVYTPRYVIQVKRHVDPRTPNALGVYYDNYYYYYYDFVESVVGYHNLHSWVTSTKYYTNPLNAPKDKRFVMPTVWCDNNNNTRVCHAKNAIACDTREEHYSVSLHPASTSRRTMTTHSVVTWTRVTIVARQRHGRMTWSQPRLE